MAIQSRGDRRTPTITTFPASSFVTLYNGENYEFQCVVVIATPPTYVVEFPSRAIRMERGGVMVTTWLPIIVDESGARDLWENTWTIRPGTMDAA
jgi:hypothetical protein